MDCVICRTLNVETAILNTTITRIYCPICGQYDIGNIAQGMIPKLITEDKRHLLSAITRQAFEASNPLTLIRDNLSELLYSIPNMTTPLENLDRVLLLIKKKQSQIYAYDHVGFNLDRDYPLAFAHNGTEFNYFLVMLAQQGLIESGVFDDETKTHRFRLTPAGWQRALELQKTQRDSNQAFVAMWFDKRMDEVWRNGFKLALEETKFNPYRIDIAEYNGKIDDQIIAEIRRSGLLIADFTGQRGGVYFEAGFAMGLGIPVIYTCRESDIDSCHFDTRQYNHITWNNPDELKTKLINRIRATIPGR